MSQVIVLDTHIWDPFDRLIIATALVYKAKLASIDGLFSQYLELDTYLMK